MYNLLEVMHFRPALVYAYKRAVWGCIGMWSAWFNKGETSIIGPVRPARLKPTRAAMQGSDPALALSQTCIVTNHH